MLQKATSYVRRVIKHPSFFNVGYADAERMLAKMDPVRSFSLLDNKKALKIRTKIGQKKSFLVLETYQLSYFRIFYNIYRVFTL